MPPANALHLPHAKRTREIQHSDGSELRQRRCKHHACSGRADDAVFCKDVSAARPMPFVWGFD